MAHAASMDDVLAGASFPADRNTLLTHATRNRANGDQLATLSGLPDRTYADRHEVTSAITGSPAGGGIRGTLSALLAAGTGAAAVRTLMRQVATRSLGPFGLVLAAVQAAIAVRAGVRAVSRWRAARRLRQASTKR
jgi:hypothetical protein